MSAARADEIMFSFKTNIEDTLFDKDGIVSNNILEQVASCITEPNEIFGKTVLILRHVIVILVACKMHV